MLDSTLVRANQQAATGKKGHNQPSITKIRMSVDGQGRQITHRSQSESGQRSKECQDYAAKSRTNAAHNIVSDRHKR